MSAGHSDAAAHTGQRLLLTGTAGFIGSTVAKQLLDAGHEVVGIDNMNDAYDIRLKQWRIEQLRPAPHFTFLQQDLLDRSALADVFSTRGPFDAVINLAARAGVRPSVDDPWVYNDSNNTATLNLLDLCVRHDVSKFILSSTSSLYGGDNPRPFREDADTDRPLSPYAASKKAAEVMCYTYHYLHGLDVTVFRYFTVYGPAGRPDMAPFRFVQWIREGRELHIFGDGEQERDFTHVDDIARGTVAGLRPVGYEVINLGSDSPVTLNRFIETIEAATGRRAQRSYSPMHRADVRATWADITKAERVLGWVPAIDLDTGVRSLVDWYEANREWAQDITTGR